MTTLRSLADRIPPHVPAPRAVRREADELAAALDRQESWGERTPATREHPAYPESGLDLARRLGLPDELPPVRLRGRPELAAAARASPLLKRVAELARWFGDGRPVTGDSPAAALSGFPAEADLPEGYDGHRLWRIALATGFVELA